MKIYFGMKMFVVKVLVSDEVLMFDRNVFEKLLMNGVSQVVFLVEFVLVKVSE